MFSVVATTRDSSTTHRSRWTTREKWTVTWFWSRAVACLTVVVVRCRRILHSLMTHTYQPYACAQPYQPDSGSHRQLLRPCWGSSAWHSRRSGLWAGLTRVSETLYCRGECKHSFKGQLHREQVVAVGWERYKQFSHGVRMEMGSENWSVCPNKFETIPTDSNEAHLPTPRYVYNKTIYFLGQ